MKQLLPAFFIILCFLSAKLFAQPTLTNANASPKPGDSYVSQFVSASGVPQQSGGAGKTWTYTNLTDSGMAASYTALLPSATPFADSFPGSNLAIKTVDDSAYIYFDANTNALLQTGIATSDSTILRSVPARTYLPYPFTYQSGFIAPVSQQVPGYNFTFNGVDSIKGDGYGTLVLPGKTYTNVLRIRYAENLSFILDTLLTRSNTTIYTVSYIYYTPDTHAPLFTDATVTTHVTSSIIGFPFPIFDSTFRSRNVSYLKTFVLPVTFQSFKAGLQNNDVLLQWKTAQEVNTEHYTVQRSLNGRDFQDIATLKATGGSQSFLYNYTDKSFAGTGVPSTVYYRVKETDKDGRQSLSVIALVQGDKAVVISVSPNPATNFIRINGSSVAMADLISIYDARGSMVQQLRNYSTSQPVDISKLMKGIYVVKLTVGDKTVSSTVIKQ